MVVGKGKGRRVEQHYICRKGQQRVSQKVTRTTLLIYSNAHAFNLGAHARSAHIVGMCASALHAQRGGQQNVVSVLRLVDLHPTLYQS